MGILSGCRSLTKAQIGTLRRQDVPLGAHVNLNKLRILGFMLAHMKYIHCLVIAYKTRVHVFICEINASHIKAI